MEPKVSQFQVQPAEDHPEVDSITYSSEKLQGRLFELAHNPVGGDVLLSRAAKALSRNIHNDDTLLRVFHEGRLERSRRGMGLPSISGSLLMLSHNVNKINFDKGIYNYPEVLGLNTTDQEEGIRRYQDLFDDIQKNHLEQYSFDITNRNIQSTDFHRGVSLPSIIHRVHGSNGIKWATIGSSAAFPEKRVAYKERFKHIDKFSIIDETEYAGQQGIVNGAIDADIQVDQLIAVDPVNPLAEGDLDAQGWFLACRMPSKVTIKDVEETKQRMAMYSNDIPNYEFREGTMQEPPVEQSSCDLVTAGTVLTHMDKDHRDEGITSMLSLLKDDERSLLVILDYIDKNGGRHGISTIKKRDPFTYGAWVCGPLTKGEMWQVYQFQNSECRGVIKAGEDFIQFMEATERFQ